MRKADPINRLVLFGLLTVLLFFNSAVAGAGKEKRQSPVTFTDATKSAGINFVHSFGDKNFSNLVEAVGSGAAWLDYDQDGWMDLYILTGKFYKGVSQGDSPSGEFLNRLYKNMGNGKFMDVTEKTGIGCKECFSMGVSVGDYNNDGWPDIFVANYGKNVLFKNNGNGTFSNVTNRAGIGLSHCSVAATWVDFDRDGWLDLYVANYIDFDPKYDLFYAPDGFPGPLSYNAEPDLLYKNRGDGTFENVTQAIGITFKGRGMSVAAGDFDNDGYDDLYVTNDATENFLYKNLAGKKFQEIAITSNVAYNGLGDQTASMGVDFGDYNNDGALDVYISDDAYSSLYINKNGHFKDIAPMSAISRNSGQFVGWGTFLFDFNNDGNLDIFKTNSDLSRLFGQEDQIFESLGNGQFRDVSSGMGAYFKQAWMGRGAAYADYDNDGDPDIIIINIASPAVLLRNDGGNKNNALIMKLVGTKSNKDGLGAKIKVTVGGKTLFAEKKAAAGYLSQSDPRMFFGLGKKKSVDKVEILWPSGTRHVIENVQAGKVITIAEPRR